MILKLLTGGIDLPKLESRAIGNTRAIANVEIDLAAKYEETNSALADHIGKANERMTAVENLVTSRALAEDVATLRMMLDRPPHTVEGDALAGHADVTLDPAIGGVVDVCGTRVSNLADGVAATDGVNKGQLDAEIASLRSTVAGLSAKVDALTATKLAEVKARKAPKKDAAK
ncbi:hypothetical protein [Brevundimonas sp. EYE_349]|uniref:hypothetical protein n=1 Tax=Brevundimonas sp. EYE_349 TaxID=2853455 RepID=UPI002004A876|nr:hypothetical protein [Brevundimonas sp. EYE_349]MCK6103339.1 hypothetical protein [Brevundimonas sp. EYE_349]